MIKRILVFTVLIVSLVSVASVSAAPAELPTISPVRDLVGSGDGDFGSGSWSGSIGKPGGGGLFTPQGAEYPNPIWRVD